ncbi:MAG: hypothetical protein ABI548_17610 [Polyangiaceae bacterium]
MQSQHASADAHTLSTAEHSLPDLVAAGHVAGAPALPALLVLPAPPVLPAVLPEDPAWAAPPAVPLG